MYFETEIWQYMLYAFINLGL